VERRDLVIPYVLRRPPRTAAQLAYAQALDAGARAIEQDVEFGGLTDSDEATADCKFNRALWRRVVDYDAADDDDTPYKLVLRRGTPAAALADLFANLASWEFDCGEAIQLLRWNAIRVALGDGAFNVKMALAGPRFELKEHDSTGLVTTHVYLRTDGDGDYGRTLAFRLEALDEVVAASTDVMLATAPGG
jgi:hypothetical protein